MRLFALCLFFLSSTSQASGLKFDDYFTVVFIDDVTESKYGLVPLNRGTLAKAINELDKAGAKGIVLKFFLDLRKDADGDRELANSISNLPVILQARIEDSEVSPNVLPKRFMLKLKTRTKIEGNSGWIPEAQFAASAYDIGFVDFDGFPISLIETYKGQTVKSLFLSTIEFATGHKADIAPEKHVKVGNLTFEMGARNETRISFGSLIEIKYIPFHEVLDGFGWKNKVKDKVVILGYDGSRIPKIETGQGAIPVHRLFVHVLQTLFQNGT